MLCFIANFLNNFELTITVLEVLTWTFAVSLDRFHLPTLLVRFILILSQSYGCLKNPPKKPKQNFEKL